MGHSGWTGARTPGTGELQKGQLVMSADHGGVGQPLRSTPLITPATGCSLGLCIRGQIHPSWDRLGRGGKNNKDKACRNPALPSTQPGDVRASRSPGRPPCKRGTGEPLQCPPTPTSSSKRSACPPTDPHLQLREGPAYPRMALSGQKPRSK